MGRLLQLECIIVRMFAAVDSPKSKSITIAYMSLKTTCISWLFMSALTTKSQGCRALLQAQMYSLLILFYKLGFILDLVSVIYFFLSDQFSRLQFYVYYFLHLTAIVVMGIALIFVPIQDFDSACPLFSWVRNGCFLMRTIFFIYSGGVMCLNLYTALRFGHCGANILWTGIWAIADAETKDNTRIIGLFHVFVSLIVVMVLAIIGTMGKIKPSTLIWRSCIKIVSICLFFIWMYSLITNKHDYNGESLYKNAYIKLGLLEILSPVLYLFFMNTQQGDPRQFIMSSYQGIFLEGREGQKLEYEQVL